MRRSIELHPEAEGKPVLIGNCQAGWQIMMMAAMRPGAVRADHARRLAAVLLGGRARQEPDALPRRAARRHLADRAGRRPRATASSTAPTWWPTSRSLNPANTYWEKPYNLYSKIDTEASRFLDFETWWGSPVLLNAEEMQWIADNLFVGNKLTAGRDPHVRTACASTCATSSRRSSCSAPGATTSRRRSRRWAGSPTSTTSDDEIVANGQTIVYTLHQTIGHLGIFVSGKVATKEHAEFASCMDMIDLMPPGLYEAVITEVDEDTEQPDLIHGKYLFTLEARTLDDIRALGANSDEDDQRFAAVARVSEINHGLYRHARTAAGAGDEHRADRPQLMRQMHPIRLRFAMFSDQNPDDGAGQEPGRVGPGRAQAGAPDNPLLALEAGRIQLDHDLVGRLSGRCAMP